MIQPAPSLETNPTSGRDVPNRIDRMLTHQEVNDLIDELGRTRRIVGPVRVGDRWVYAEVLHAQQLDLSFPYCVYGPKSLLFPPKETLFTFDQSKGTFSCRSVREARPLVLAGVHPCDLAGIRLLDHVFSADHPDPHYLARRRATVIIGVDCPRPCTAGVFCRDMGTNEAKSGFDVMCYPIWKGATASATTHAVVFGADAHRDILEFKRRGREPTVEDEREFLLYRKGKSSAFPFELPVEATSLPRLLEESYDSLVWKATARRCYSCGSCNLVCPTCYCFDVRDEAGPERRRGERVREWDGCQLRGFSEVTGGHNFRALAAARLRHRVFRKGRWIAERTGMSGCVGCGRCERACTAGISLSGLYRQLAEEN